MDQPLAPLRLPVRTVSGQRLGHVADVTIDPATHAVWVYHVKLSRLLPDIVQSPLIIRPSQVVEINQREMVVDDNTQGQTQASPAALPTA